MGEWIGIHCIQGRTENPGEEEGTFGERRWRGGEINNNQRTVIEKESMHCINKQTEITRVYTS